MSECVCSHLHIAFLYYGLVVSAAVTIGNIAQHDDGVGNIGKDFSSSLCLKLSVQIIPT